MMDSISRTREGATNTKDERLKVIRASSMHS